MTVSQNGWSANDRSVVSARLVPGTGVKLTVRNGAPGDLLLEVLARFDREVEDLDQGADDWGYAERNVRGSATDVSNHASGTAADADATRHPLGKRGTFTVAQVATIHRILAAALHVVRWGGDYTGRADEMHFELADGTTEADCVRALAALRGTATGAPTSPTAVVVAHGGALARGAKGPAVGKLQRVLAAWYPDLHLLEDDDYGPATEAAVRYLQQHSNGALTVDGIAGPATLRFLHLA